MGRKPPPCQVRVAGSNPVFRSRCAPTDQVRAGFNQRWYFNPRHVAATSLRCRLRRPPSEFTGTRGACQSFTARMASERSNEPGLSSRTVVVAAPSTSPHRRPLRTSSSSRLRAPSVEAGCLAHFSQEYPHVLRCRCRGRDCFVDNGSHRIRLQKVGYMHWSLRRSTFTMLAMPTASLSRTRVGVGSFSPSEG
jgi:hypothetical protein